VALLKKGAYKRLTGVSGGDNGVVGDWLLSIIGRHDNRRGCGGVATTTLLTTGSVRRLVSSFSISESPGDGISMTSFALTSLDAPSHIAETLYVSM